MQINKMPSEYFQQVLGKSDVERSPHNIRDVRSSLEPFGLTDAEDSNNVVNIPVPDFLGTWKTELDKSITDYGRKHLNLLSDVLSWNINRIPDHFTTQPGWWCFHENAWQRCKPPSNRCVILDFEAIRIGYHWYPLCMVGLLKGGWVLWVADITDYQRIATENDIVVQRLDPDTGDLEESFDYLDTHEIDPRRLKGLPSVIPFGESNTIIGYNTPYDRQYLESEYYLRDSGNRFFDLMSAWIVSQGMSNQQRVLYKTLKNAYTKPSWFTQTTTNGLDAVYKHLFDTDLDKGVRDEIVGQGLPWIVENMESVVSYCAKDVLSTFHVFKRLYPVYLNRRSVPSQVAHLMMGSYKIPLDNGRFHQFFDKAEGMFMQIKGEIADILYQASVDFKVSVLTNYTIPLKDLKAVKGSKEDKEAQRLAIMGNWLKTLPERMRHLDWTPALSGANTGEPKWFRKICKDYKEGNLSISQRFAVTILDIKWKDSPLLWGNVFDETEDVMRQGWYTHDHGALPHPRRRGKNLVNIFCKDYVSLFERGVLKADRDLQPILEKLISTINWISLRKRTASIHIESPEGFPMVVPQISPNGTITGRCADNLWQVMANPKSKRIGTELKSMISPPSGYVFVGADVDSQEAWLAGLMGDMATGICGSTPMGFITIAGQNTGDIDTSSDIHSVMVRETEMEINGILTRIPRGKTKNRVYGAVYGQGVKGDQNFLLQEMPDLSEEDTFRNSKLFVSKFKGSSSYMGGRKIYCGGLASSSFNNMEAIADSPYPKTILLNNIMSAALAGSNDFKPSRVNWTIQSSGADFRDLLLLYSYRFFKLLGADAFTFMTIHDEIRCIAVDSESNIVKTAYALQLAHLYTRCAFLDVTNMDILPAGVAWFSGIDIDRYCLRKDPHENQVTPSQPEGLPLGEVWTPEDLRKKVDKTIKRC